MENQGNNKLIEFPVLVEGSEEIITLFLTSAEIETASNDQNFLLEKVHELNQLNQKTDKDEEDERETKNKSDVWEEKAVFLFLEIYREKENEFKKTKRHNKIWQDIANEFHNKNKSWHYSGMQCSSKMSGLKRTYKNIKDQNKKSGNSRVTWSFLSIMESLFSEKAYMKPIVLAGSEDPSKPSTSKIESPVNKKRRVEIILENFINQTRTERDEINKEKIEDRKRQEKEKSERYVQKLEQKERMHREKMEFRNSLLELLSKAIDK